MELTPRTTSLTPPSVVDLTSLNGDPWLRLMEQNPLIFQHLLNASKHNLRSGSTNNNRGGESGGAPLISNLQSRSPRTLRSPQTPEMLLNTIGPLLTGNKRPASSPLSIEANFPLVKNQALRFPGKFKEPEPQRRFNGNQLDDSREGISIKKKTSTRETTCILKNWLYEHRKNPYPTKEEKVMLAAVTRMNLTQVSTWFANARRRLKKENQLTWCSKNRPISQSIQHQPPLLPPSIQPSPVFQPIPPIYWNGDQNLARALGTEVQSMLFSQMIKDIRDRMGNRSGCEAKFRSEPLSPHSTSPAKIWSLADLVEEQPKISREVSDLKKDS
ncbi:hypothetical protein Aperf_G00000116558 [Anoplocephala perfoliata]